MTRWRAIDRTTGEILGEPDPPEGGLSGATPPDERPLVLPSTNGPTNVMGNTDGPPAYGLAGGQTFMGLQIVVDASLPTAVGTSSRGPGHRLPRR